MFNKSSNFNPEERRMNLLSDYQNRASNNELQYIYNIGGQSYDPNMENITFSYKFNNRNPKIVYVSGSFDDLKEKHPLNNNSRMENGCVPYK